MRKTRWGESIHPYLLSALLCLGLMGVLGCGTSASSLGGSGGGAGGGGGDSPDPVPVTPIPTPAAKYDLAGTWERNDQDETLTVTASGTVASESLALDPASTFRNVVPCDGEKHRLSSAPENAVFSQMEMVIGPYAITVDDNGQVAMGRHIYQEIWVGDAFPAVEMYISATGQMTSPTAMTVQTLKEPTGLRQTWTYTKTGG